MSERGSDRKSGKYVVCCRTVEYSSSQNAGGEVGGLDKRCFAMRIDVYHSQSADGLYLTVNSICPVQAAQVDARTPLLRAAAPWLQFQSIPVHSTV